ncbi:nucleoporin-like protein amo1 isoform X2 [Vespa mandarinia]|nr:nucleoporin-like protein amo1 isoform X2 [Vespa mandarinia]
MIACKYYRQGNCRYGQYCQFEHFNAFGNTNNKNNITAVVVASEVLIAERGNQWLLSCFAPFKERPHIPGMEDVSPEEVRWEMYQAQKNGVVEQAKLRYQQLCEDMKAKRDALKNPTQETVDMLKKILGDGHNTETTNNTSKFSFATSQTLILNLPNSTTTTNVFGTKSFQPSQNNTFGNSFGTSNNPSPFVRTNNSTSLFGASSTFGNNALTFPNVTNSNSVFGKTGNTSVFGTGQNNQAFGTVPLQNNSIFGGAASQTVFGQPSNFGTTTQTTNVFARPSISQTTTSVFDSGAVPSNSLFYTPQSNTSLFGENKPSTTGPFGESSAIQTSNSIFGSTTSSGNLSTNSTSIFGQPKTTTAFGSPLVFGANGSFQNNSTPSIFGGQTFNKDAQVPSDNIFGRFITSSNFGTASQGTNVFTKTTSNIGLFGVPQNAQPIIPATNATSFVSAATTTSIPFGTVNSQIDPKNTYAIARPSFGITNTSSPLSNTVTSPTIQFGATTGTSFNGTTNISSPFTIPSFGGFTSSFMQTNTTVTTTTTNPFISQQTNSSFNGAIQNPNGTVNESLVTNQPNEKSLFTFAQKNTAIDDTIYSEEVHLTDDEKAMYLADQFVIGKIPLKPPCESMR